ncbi:MAG: O-antigen ligase family protein, partial [Candidatus Levybacteria bacterium]|nr:O-antigen ligase family protein [Candidatus Levybacteria bacterium]
TFSRSALMMLIISASLLFILMNKKIWIAILIGITFLVLVISSRYFNIENINLFRAVSSEARLETAKNAVKIIQDYPIFGIGFNAYRYAQFRYGFRNDLASSISHADASPDNSFLFVAATSGLVGFVLFVVLWFKILNYSMKNNPLVLSSIVGICINSLFINSLFYPFIMLWLWIIIAVKVNK